MKKQYGKFILLCLVTITVLSYILYYNLKKEEPSVLTGYINEIKYNGINNYIIENSHVVIYATSSNSNKQFENNLKNIVIKYNLSEKIVYYKNTNYKETKDTAYNKTNILVFYYNRKITKIISTKNMSYDKLLKLFKEVELIDE